MVWEALEKWMVWLVVVVVAAALVAWLVLPDALGRYARAVHNYIATFSQRVICGSYYTTVWCQAYGCQKLPSFLAIDVGIVDT